MTHRLDRFALITLAVALATILARPAAALDLDGFQPDAGTLDLAVSFTTESYDEFWVGTTEVSDPGLGEVDTRSLSLWARYGVTDRIAVLASLPWVDVAGDGLAGFEDDGIQDLSVVAQFLALRRETGAWRHQVVVGGGLRTPVGDYEGNAPVSLGDDTTDGLLRATWLGQRGSWWVSQQIGFELRGGAAPNGWGLRTEVGRAFGERVAASAFLALGRADGGTDIGEPGFTFPSNREEWDRVGAKVLIGLTDQLRLSASGFTTLDGRNTGHSSGLGIGVVATWD